MKEELKKTYRGFLGWIRYVRDYKDNIDNDLVSEQRLIDARKEIEALREYIQKDTNAYKELEFLIELREDQIHKLNDKVGELQRERKELQEMIVNQTNCVEVLTKKLQKKEQSRRASAGAIGGLKAKINDLTNKLAKAEYTIEYYRNNRKKPNVEEIKAYEYSRKAVEKRIKDAEK